MTKERKNPKPSSDAARRRMQSVRQRDTKAEVVVRRAIFRRGFRFRVQIRPLPEVSRRADVVFTKEKVAVFVDGCFWHSCPIHGTSAKANAEFWRNKLARIGFAMRRPTRSFDATAGCRFVCGSTRTQTRRQSECVGS